MIALPAPPVTPLICYEVIFPHAVVDPGEPRPGWLVNITDDSWFGPWAGPRQHLLIARVRAIEEGLPIARAANTGISAMIDPYGTRASLVGLNKMGVVDAGFAASASGAALMHGLAILYFRRFWLSPLVGSCCVESALNMASLMKLLFALCGR